jgi:tRNA modification GTPase
MYDELTCVNWWYLHRQELRWICKSTLAVFGLAYSVSNISNISVSFIILNSSTTRVMRPFSYGRALNSYQRVLAAKHLPKWLCSCLIIDGSVQHVARIHTALSSTIGHHETCKSSTVNISSRSANLGQHKHRIQSFSTVQLSSDTIFALATPPGHSAIAVIRISGPSVKSVYTAICPDKQLPKPRYAAVRTLYEPATQEGSLEILDPSALVLYFPGPHSSTGEDVLELHVHGGRAIIRSVLQAIASCSRSDQRVRHAEAGEFTKRSFLSGRLDLPQAEALGAILAAETDQQRRAAVIGARGGLGKRYDDWRLQLVEARGELEALIDFAEDQQFEESPEKLVAGVVSHVRNLKQLVEYSIQNAVKGELLRNGIQLTVLGKPNAGKSSLLNVIVGREAAIVSSKEGTTRDIVEVGVDISGWFVRIGDTAGLRTDSSSPNINNPKRHSKIDSIEREGMRRALDRAESSDVVLLLLDITRSDNGTISLEVDKEVISAAQLCIRSGSHLVVAINKMDVMEDEELSPVEHAGPTNQMIDGAKHLLLADMFDDPLNEPTIPVVPISCLRALSPDPSIKTASNISALLEALTATFRSMTSATSPDQADSTLEQVMNQPDMSVWQESLGATERQRVLLQECASQLETFLILIESTTDSTEEIDVVLAAEHLRSAADCLARVTGRGQAGDVEEVLGVVFEK